MAFKTCSLVMFLGIICPSNQRIISHYLAKLIRFFLMLSSLERRDAIQYTTSMRRMPNIIARNGETFQSAIPTFVETAYFDETEWVVFSYPCIASH